MEGVTDAAMRAVVGEWGAFDYSVSEFIRVSNNAVPKKVFRRDVPEVGQGSVTPTGLPVQVQILGGDPDLMADSARNAVMAGATAIDINFGCPAPTVNRHDGGASLLRHPSRIREIVRAVRDALPLEIPVSAKLRLGWDCVDDIDVNAVMVEEGGASWITVHARTKMQGYRPPVSWEPIRRVREALHIPVVANGDLWNCDDLTQCMEATGCRHFMLGRGALADPLFAIRARSMLRNESFDVAIDWEYLWARLFHWLEYYDVSRPSYRLVRLKQWASLAAKHGCFPEFESVKMANNVDEFIESYRMARSNGVRNPVGVP
jgi:tRNA-dihydrouridine synthase C